MGEVCYDFHQQKDSSGNALSHHPGESTEQLRARCSKDIRCRGFNTWGWLVNAIRPESEWRIYGNTPEEGLYIKKECPTPPKVLVPDEEEPMSMYAIIGIIVAIIMLIVFPVGYFMFFSGGEQAAPRFKTNL